MINESLTVIIPVFRMSMLRERNFWYVVQNMRLTGVNILIAEQRITGFSRVLAQKIDDLRADNIEYCGLDVDDHRIHKSKLINYAVDHVKTPYVWVNDADCIMDFPKVLKTLVLDCDFIRPYKAGVDLTEQETQQLIESGSDHVKITDKARRNVKVYGALSFIFKKDAFNNIGGMNEKYVGWGLEDFELRHRVLSKKYQIKVMKHLASHMWHPRPEYSMQNWNLPESMELSWIKRNVFNNRKIIHVVNLLDPAKIQDDDFRTRVNLALESIEQAHKERVMLLGCVDDTRINVKGWTTVQLNRTTKETHDDDRRLAYVKDMFDAALAVASPEDYILYTNLDCIVTNNIYDQIMSMKTDAMEFHRRDVAPSESLVNIFNQTGQVLKTGVDGFAIKVKHLKNILDSLPDFVIGEPHWDIGLSKILNDNLKTVKDVMCLYHVKHPRKWDLEKPTVVASENADHTVSVVDEQTAAQLKIHKRNTPLVIPEPAQDESFQPAKPVLRPTRDMSRVPFDQKQGVLKTTRKPAPPPVRLEDTPLPQFVYTNELCVMIVCCYEEYKTGKLGNLLLHCFNSNSSKNKKYDVFVCFDRVPDDEYGKILNYIKDRTRSCDNIENIILYNVDIPAEENVFTYNARVWKERIEQFPGTLRLGSSSGANLLFYGAIEYIFKQNTPKYENVLLVECDCQIINQSWYDKLHDECFDDFAIRGSRYRGEDENHTTRFYADHLNGVAIYKNCDKTNALLRQSKQEITQYVFDENINEVWLNFDVALHLASISLSLQNYMKETNMISNYSDPGSADLELGYILNRHPETVFLHKKYSEI